MAYTSRIDDNNSLLRTHQDSPANSRVARPADDRYTTSRQNDNRYTSDYQQADERTYEGIRRTGDKHSTIQNLVTGGPNRPDTNRPNGNYEFSKPPTTTNVVIDSNSRPSQNHGRSCVIEINVTMNCGGNRNPRTSVATKDYAPRSVPIRSQTTIDDAHYIDLNYTSSDRSAQISTDGMIRNPTAPQRSVAFSNDKNY